MDLETFHKRPAATFPSRKLPEDYMIAVIFEVLPHAETKQTYLDIASSLRPLLEPIDGFVSIERFQSLSDPGKILSLSFWRDEAAIAGWRQVDSHRGAQAKGRGELFRD